MPKAFPIEFRHDVIAVARRGDASIAQVARDFGVSESYVQRWLKLAERDDGLIRPGSRTGPSAGDRGPAAAAAAQESAEVKELRKRNRLLEQENEILRRAAAYLSRDLLPK